MRCVFDALAALSSGFPRIVGSGDAAHVVNTPYKFGKDVHAIAKLRVALRPIVEAYSSARDALILECSEGEATIDALAKPDAARRFTEADKAIRAETREAAGLRLHPVMSRFVSDVWSKVLVYACIKHGHASEASTIAVEALDQLLWAIQPLNDLADVEKRDRSRVALVTSLRADMEMVSLPEDEIADHAENVLRHLTEISMHDRAYLEASNPQERIQTELEVIPEVVLAAGVDDVDEAPPPAAEALLLRIAEGTWFELGPDTPHIRCKLATILNDGKRFIFVNRKGMKVAERNRAELGKELLAGSTTILDDNQIFDKALQAVIGNLREMRQQPTPAVHQR